GVETLVPGRLHEGDDEAEAGDGHGEGVDVHTVDRTHGLAGTFPGVESGFLLRPLVEESLEGADEEVARTAGRVDELKALKGTFGQGRGQGAVEDELLDEHGGLAQGVLLLGVGGEVLVQVAQETGVQLRVVETPDG